VCNVICNEAVPFRPYCVGVATRTRNVSEYMLVLAVCLVIIVVSHDGRVIRQVLQLAQPFRTCSLGLTVHTF